MPAPSNVDLSGNNQIDALLTGNKWNTNTLTFSFPDSGFWYVLDQVFDSLNPLDFAQTVLNIGRDPLGSILDAGLRALLGPYESIAMGIVALNDFGQFNGAQQAVARHALANVHNFANMNFSEVTEGAFTLDVDVDVGGIFSGIVNFLTLNWDEISLDDIVDIDIGFTHGDIRFAETDSTARPAFGLPPLDRLFTTFGEPVLGDTWYRNDGSFDNAALGNNPGETIIHELGHALGLKHSQESGLLGGSVGGVFDFILTDVNGPIMDPAVDNTNFTVMSYNNTGTRPGFASTFMMLDIQALQYMYGVQFIVSDDTYTWNTATGPWFINGVRQNSGANLSGDLLMTIWDGGGTDTYDFSNFTEKVTLDLAPGQWATTSNGLYDVNVANALLYQGNLQSLIENANGGSAGDDMRGNQIRNILRGNGGADTLRGLDGNDDLYGGNEGDSLFGDNGTDNLFGDDGDDKLFGGNERDILRGGNQNDELAGEEGDDDLYGDNGDDTLAGGNGSNRLDGGNDTDTIDYTNQAATVVVVLSTNSAGGVGFTDTLISIENITGSGHADFIFGDDAVNRLLGGGGVDFIAGGGSGDTIGGGAEGDTLFGDAGADTLDGDGGADNLFGGADGDTLNGGADGDTLNGEDGVDILNGGSGVDALNGGADGDTLNGGADGDTLNGDGGEDALNGDGGSDILNGGADNDTLRGGGDGDKLDGGAGRDRQLGGFGNDEVAWDAGDDLEFVLGGEDFDGLDIDTLTFNGPDLLFSFDLEAHEFEQARGKVTDTGGAAWDTIETTYNTSWTVLAENVRNDDGTSKNTKFNIDGPLDKLVEYFNAGGVLTFQEAFNDDGTRRSTAFYANGQAQYIDDFNARGERTSQEYFRADGSRQQTTVWDVTGALGEVAYYVDHFNSESSRTAQTAYYDRPKVGDGQRDYDTTVWSDVAQTHGSVTGYDFSDTNVALYSYIF